MNPHHSWQRTALLLVSTCFKFGAFAEGTFRDRTGGPPESPRWPDKNLDFGYESVGLAIILIEIASCR